MRAQGRDHNSGVFAGHLHQHRKTRMALHQGYDVTVARTAQQIALPMTGNGSVFDFCGPFPDGNGHDLAAALPTNTRMPRAADPPLERRCRTSSFFSTAHA